MAYVSRDETGAINGVYANPQPGYGEEYLPDDDPEVTAFLATMNAPPTPQPSPEDVVLYDHENRLRSLEGEPPLSIEEFGNRQ